MLNLSNLTKLGDGSIQLDPRSFYGLVDLIQDFQAGGGSAAFKPTNDLLNLCVTETDAELDNLRRICSSLQAEVRNTRRRQNPFSSQLDQEDPFADLRHSTGATFVTVVYEILKALNHGFHQTRKLLDGVEPKPLLLSDKRPALDDYSWIRDQETIQQVTFEISVNAETVGHFVDAILSLDVVKERIVDLAYSVSNAFDAYYSKLLKRHTTDGILIHESPIATDLALSVFENVDAHGEIEDGKSPEEISAFSIRKASLLIQFIQTGSVQGFISKPETLIEDVKKQLASMWEIAEMIETTVSPLANDIRSLMGYRRKSFRFESTDDFTRALSFLDDLNPQNISYREKQGLLTAEERFEQEYTNETLSRVAKMLVDCEPPQRVVEYVLKRKAEVRDYYEGENTFYTCRIGNGNPFLGEAPGALSIQPGQRPNVSLDEIVGSGFDKIREFVSQIESSAKFHDLFVATSPSRSADKNNVLLIGPQGCGKSEVLRAVGADRDSVGIFAQGSDFLTCWKGEAEKNPKRLFEGAVKLQKSSKKHVHILIDEIDTILNDDRGPFSFGGTELKTEFQILMDGIVRYPRLSVWGATNHPDRIPMPMIRRFSQVLVVGELTTDEERIRLLQHFASFLPFAKDLRGDSAWSHAAGRLEGATGDVIRKIIDYVWRSKMHDFVQSQPEKAEKLVEVLNTGDEGPEQFDISRFDSNKRKEFKKALLDAGVAVCQRDINESVDMHLSNIAIQSEIKTAVATYEASRKLLAGLQKSAVEVA